MKSVFVFLCALLLGLLIQATLIHSLFPSALAPDFVIVLVLYLGLSLKNGWGAAGAFLLGLGADFATARFIGPTAAGSVVAFCVVVALSNRVYAEKGFAIIVLAFLASLVNRITFVLMVWLYTSNELQVSAYTVSMFLEAVLTAVIAPFVLRALSVSRGRTIFAR